MPAAGLAQAGAVIAGQHLDYGTYLERLRRIPASKLLPPAEAGGYPRGAAAAILLSVDGVRDGDSGALCGGVMNLLSVLSPAGVPRHLVHAAGRDAILVRAGPEEISAEAVDGAVGRLARVSLLTFSVDGATVITHRLVMRVIRDQLAGEGRLDAVCEAVAWLLESQASACFPTLHEQRAAARGLVEQIMALHASCAPETEDSELARRMIRVRLWATSILNELGDSAQQAILVGEPLLADQERVLGADHPDTLGLRNNLAAAYQAAGRAADAIPLHERTLADRERVLGPDHPSTLGSRNNLAAAYQDAGRAAEAIPLHEQALAGKERVLGPDHPATLDSRNNLANAYQDAGRAAEAIPLHERTLADMKRVLGPDHPHTLGSRNNLANAYHDAGRPAEAEAVRKRTEPGS
jgi:Tetratricopeptide repeat